MPLSVTFIIAIHGIMFTYNFCIVYVLCCTKRKKFNKNWCLLSYHTKGSFPQKYCMCDRIRALPVDLRWCCVLWLIEELACCDFQLKKNTSMKTACVTLPLATIRWEYAKTYLNKKLLCSNFSWSWLSLYLLSVSIRISLDPIRPTGHM